MDPLETLFRPVLALANTQIAQSTPARDLCEELDGRVVAIRVRDSSLALYCRVTREGLDVTTRYEDEPDTVITGSLVALAGLATGDAAAAIRSGRIEIEGDTETASRFRDLLRFARPDVEERLSGILGDAGAHQAGEMLRGLGVWGRQVADTLTRNISEYVTEERGDLPARGEVDVFYADVDRLRDDLARLEARIRALQDRQTG
ncbi:MAG: SCP2 sterol-binding domain-containing protein [Gammaproteobacteria bacterium]